MRVNEAKDFLVGQTAEQARREGVSFSDLEKRMMYFTESDDAVENPIALNEEFEAQYDTPEYESKIAGLLGRAYNRLKKEGSGEVSTWDEAIRELKKGDHYVLVMWSERRVAAHPWSFWKTTGASLLLVVFLFAIVLTLNHYDFHIFDRTKNQKGISASGTYGQVPVWVQRSLLAVLVAGYIYAVAAPTINRFFATSSRKVVGMFRRS